MHRLWLVLVVAWLCSGGWFTHAFGHCQTELWTDQHTRGPRGDHHREVRETAQLSGYFFENSYCASNTSFSAGYTFAWTSASSL